MDSKKTILFVTFVLLVGIFSGVFFFKSNKGNELGQIFKGQGGIPSSFENDKLYTLDDISLSAGSKVWLTGQYLGEGLNIDSVDMFVLGEEKKTLDVDVSLVDESLSLSQGDYVLLQGNYDVKTFFRFKAEEIYILTQENYSALLSKRYPSVEIEIVNKEVVLDHGCQNASVQAKIKNVGEMSIDYQKTASKKTEYVFIAVIDDEIVSIFPDSDFDDPENIPVGYAFGFRDFGVLEPGQEKTVRFGLDGYVESTQGGVGGSTNVFCRDIKEGPYEGSFRIDFGNVKPQDKGMKIGLKYAFTNMSRSNEIDVRVDNCQCVLKVDSLPEPL